MTMRVIPCPLYFPDVLRTPTAAMSATTIVLDAAGEKRALVFSLPKAGTITKIGFHVSAVTTSETLRVGLETVGADGLPTGTQFGGSAVGTQVSPAGGTSYAVALATGATVAAGDVGDLVAAVIQFDSATGNLRLGSVSSANGGSRLPYGVNHDGASWAKSDGAGFSILWAEYSDGSVEDIGTMVGISGAHSFNSGSSPDEYGARFTLPIAARVWGIWFVGSLPAGADYELVLYEGTTAHRTRAHDGDQSGGTGIFANYVHIARFETPLDLAANTEYIAALRPTTATSLTLRYMDVLAAAVWDGLGGSACHQAHRTDQGAWSALTTRRPSIGPILDGFDDAGGGGGDTVTGSRFNRGFN